MFFKRRDPLVPVLTSSSEITTIPEVFYAGNDPEATGGTPNKNPGKQTAFSSGESPSTRTHLIAGVMITVFLIVLGLGGWYLVHFVGFGASAPAPTVPQNKVVTPPPNPNPVTEVTSTSPQLEVTASTVPEILTTSTTVVVTSTVSTLVHQLALEFPAINQIDSADLDADGLTDAEEELFGTDPGIFDTDNDNYYDGQEMLNLYNPKAIAPVRLIDSGTVKELVQTRGLYRVYYPLVWEVGVVDPAGESTLITAANGDYIEYKISQKNIGEDFTTWFGRMASSERITDLQPGLNRFGVSYWHRKDDLVAYVDQPNFVLVIVCHPQSNAPIAFRHVMQMMFASLRLNNSSTTLPPQTPGPVGTSTTP